MYWSAQKRICAALWDPDVHTVVVPAGHSTGKSFCSAGAIVGWPTLIPDSMTVSTSPSNTQLSAVLWKEVRKAFGGSVLPGYGRITGNPEKLDYGGGLLSLGFACSTPERAQGHHSAGPLLVVVDEASGITDPDIWATLKSLKPRKRLLISNPLRPDGKFFELCEQSKEDPAVRLIHVPSTDSPDIGLEHSTRGLADASWLREMAAEYGVDSLTYLVRVLAQFPGDAHDALLMAEWLTLAGRTVHLRSGPTRTTVDVSEGRGGDLGVILTRDDNGVLELDSSNRWGFDELARMTMLQSRRWAVEPRRVVYDATGPGADFGNRLAAEGIHGAQPFRGGAGGGPKKRFGNFRTAAAWAMRQRLDPGHLVTTPGGLMLEQAPFSIPPEYLRVLGPELRGLRYFLLPGDGVELEAKEHLTARLRHSPDHADCLLMSFAFPG